MLVLVVVVVVVVVVVCFSFEVQLVVQPRACHQPTLQTAVLIPAVHNTHTAAEAPRLSV